VIIRPAGEADLEAIAAIQGASPEASQWNPADYLTYSCLVAANGQVAGFIVIREIGPQEYEILNLAVAPDVRQRGVAGMLLEFILQAHPGTWFLELRESNFPALKLYEKAGFTSIAKRSAYYSDSRESAIVMRLQR